LRENPGPRHVAGPIRRGRARPGAGTPCTTRWTEPRRRRRRASSVGRVGASPNHAVAFCRRWLAAFRGGNGVRAGSGLSLARIAFSVREPRTGNDRSRWCRRAPWRGRRSLRRTSQGFMTPDVGSRVARREVCGQAYPQ